MGVHQDRCQAQLCSVVMHARLQAGKLCLPVLHLLLEAGQVRPGLWVHVPAATAPARPDPSQRPRASPGVTRSKGTRSGRSSHRCLHAGACRHHFKRAADWVAEDAHWGQASPCMRAPGGRQKAEGSWNLRRSFSRAWHVNGEAKFTPKLPHTEKACDTAIM